MRSNLVLTILFLSTIFFSCQNKTTEVADDNTDLIEITKAQFDTEKMEFGEPVLSSFSNLVHFTGTIVPKANGHAQISLPVPGIISTIYGKPGQNVGKGMLLLEVSGNALIDLQKDFAESAAMLQRLKSEYERANELYRENIGTKKEFMLAESSYNGEKAKSNALKMKLEQIGLDVNKIEAGEFYSSYSLKTPIKGSLTTINATIGQYIESQQTIAEIIDPESFQIKLSVFEKDINKLKVEQQTIFYLAGNKEEKFTAKLSSVGKAIMSDSKSIECYASIENFSNTNFVSRQFVEGEVIVNSETVLSLPESAIIKSENEAYVLVLEKETPENYYFTKAKVKTGRKNNNYIEIKEVLQSKRVLVKGVYNLIIE